MANEILVGDLKNIALSYFEIHLYDIVNDFLISYSYENNSLIEKHKESLSMHLENIKNIIKPEFVKEYMNFVSIPKLESKIESGIDVFYYETLDNKSYQNICTVVNINGNKCILMLRKNQEVKMVGKSNDVKYNSLIDALADAILKIHNIFNMDEKILSNIDNVKQYIDSVFTYLTSSYPELKKSFNTKAANVSGRVSDTILIVDDDLLTRNMIKKIFNDEYKIVMATNGKEAIEYIKQNSLKGINEASDHVIGIFLDLTMPVLDGFAVLDYLSENGYLNRIPVIIISGDYEKETKNRAYNYNIADMLEKPFDFEIVKHRISNFINLYKSSNSLDRLINDQTENLKSIIDAYTKSYFYDYDSNIKLISKYIKVLATKVMEDYEDYDLSEDKISKMMSASKYYDIGFYSIPRVSLMKNGNYDDNDIKYIKNYPLFGSKVVSYLLNLTSDEEYKTLAKNICMYCHENFDGTGYPKGLVADDIPVEAQITAICIAYANIKDKLKAESIIISKSGTLFNPKIIESFRKVLSEFKQIN